MKILFCARHFGYLRNFESVIAMLAERGHEVRLVADRDDPAGGAKVVERLAGAYPSVSVGRTPSRDGDEWLAFASKIRLARDYLRYLDRRYERTPKLRQRSKERSPAFIVGLVERYGFRYRPARAFLAAALDAIERSLPWNPAIDEFFRTERPDAVLLTPLIDLGSPQLDFLKSARALSLPTVLCVGSWDHLSSKALIRILPDLMTVWNDTQRQEAIELHGVPASRVAVTGAQCYDQWFGRQPGRSREEFCRAVGLPDAGPFLLYLCSSLFRGGATEAEFVRTWIQHVRAAEDPTLRDVPILVRPHPGRMDEWASVDISGFPRVAFNGRNPVDADAKADYFDALHFSTAVVGLNTSAFLEAGIVGRPVYAVLLQDYWKSQEGTLHFQYLLNVAGGLLRTSRSLDEHIRQLTRLLAGQEPPGSRERAFVEAFLRPQGLDQPSTPRFVQAIETLAPSAVAAAGAKAPAPFRVPIWAPVVRAMVSPLVHAARVRKARHRLAKDLRHEARKTVQRAQRSVRKGVMLQVERRVARARRIVMPRTEAARARLAAFEDLEEVQATREAITALARGRRPILVGPWISEAGFELLYWIPFLAWAKSYGNLRGDRLIAISRGGAAPWYGRITSHYADLYDFFTPEEFRSLNADRIAALDGQKHFAMMPLDEEILRRVKRASGLDDVDVLHPSLMYNLFRLFWLQKASLDSVYGFTLHNQMKTRTLPHVPGLPARFVAVKFYTNQALPDTAENRAFVKRVLTILTERHEVVLLNTGIQFDDHGEFSGPVRKRLHVIDRIMSPSTNLQVQTAVIARAEALVGTYGGFSYLGPLCGVDTLTFYSAADGFRFDHLELAKRVFRNVEGGSFVALDRQDLGLIELGLGGERFVSRPQTVSASTR